MFHHLMIVAAICMSADVRLQPTEGEALQGELLSLTGEMARIDVDGATVSLPTSDIQWIRTGKTTVEPTKTAAAWIQLTDGSEIQAADYQTRERTASIVLRTGQTADIAIGAIRVVRYGQSDDELDLQWKDILTDTSAADLIVIRGPNQELRQVEGVIGDITEQFVKFNHEDEWIDVRKQKVDGVVYYKTADDRLPSPLCRCTTLDGSLWNLRSLKVRDELVEMTTVSGAPVSLPLKLFQEFGFAAGKTVYLADVEPESVDVTPLVQIDEFADQIEQMIQPRRNRSLLGGKLRVRQDDREMPVLEFDRGLALHSRTKIVYRLGGKYRRFVALAGIDEAVDQNGSVTLVISVDGSSIFSHDVRGQQNPIPIDLDVTGANRMSILVDFGDESDFADHLNLCDARLTK